MIYPESPKYIQWKGCGLGWVDYPKPCPGECWKRWEWIAGFSLTGWGASEGEGQIFVSRGNKRGWWCTNKPQPHILSEGSAEEIYDESLKHWDRGWASGRNDCVGCVPS
jgi:hypothetical protein